MEHSKKHDMQGRSTIFQTVLSDLEASMEYTRFNDAVEKAVLLRVVEHITPIVIKRMKGNKLFMKKIQKVAQQKVIERFTKEEECTSSKQQ